jgi:AcrR family transcriptional regulator
MSRTPDLLAKISLLRAAEEVFAEKGITLAKVEEITRRAGLSKGAFYLHFDSKEDAFKEVVESFLARCATLFQGPHELEHSIPSDVPGMLAFMIDRDEQTFEFLWQNRAIISIIEGCSGEQGYLRETFLRGQAGVTRAWCELWQRRGLFRSDMDLDVVSSFLVGAYRSLVVRMVASETRPPLRHWLGEAQRFMVRGLGTDPARIAERAKN